MFTKISKCVLTFSFVLIFFFHAFSCSALAAVTATVASATDATEPTLPNVIKYYEGRIKEGSFGSDVIPEVIRIGYQGNYAIIKTPLVEGQPGYGYEYFSEILKHTKKKYIPEYIQVERGKGLEMLEKGELDIFAGVGYTTDRARKFLFSKEDMGKDTLLLLALRDSDERNSYESIEGSRIAISKGSSTAKFLYSFIDENYSNVYTEELDFESVHRLKQLNSFDYVFLGSMQMEAGLKSVASFGYSPIYFMANKDKQELIDDIDQATNTVLTLDYLTKERLYLKYFDNVTAQNTLGYDEYTFLQEQPVYTVGVPILNSPLVYSSSDQPAGIFIDILEMIKNMTGININIVQIDKDTPDSVLRTIDFALLSKKDQALLNLPTSTPLTFLPYVIVKKAFEKENQVVGTLDYYGLTSEDINFFMKAPYILEYSSLPELIEAFNYGEIDNMFLTLANLTSLASNITVKDYTTTPIEYWYMPTISYSPDLSLQKRDLFDKVISQLNPSSIENSIIRNIAFLNSRDVFYYLHEYRYGIIVLVFVTITMFIFLTYHMNKVRARELEEIIDFDRVTGLYTYPKFLEAVKKIINENKETDYYIVSFDIDNFRYINEIYGYTVGSEILKHISHHIKQNMPKTLPMARNTGDNFLFLCEREDLFDKTKQLSFKPALLSQDLKVFTGEDYNVSFSIGAYEIVDKSFDVNYMVDCANIARNKSKVTFGTNFEIFFEDMKKMYTEQNKVLAHVQSAFLAKEFVMYYQPKFDIQTMKIVGAESLIRWFKDDKMIPPDLFIPIIEEHGAIDQLDYYVVDAVCSFIKKHADLDIPKIAINMSGHTVVKEAVIAKILEIINFYEIRPSKIDIEITESALVDNINGIVDKIEKLRDLGISISMDDFGAGISSLNRLRNIPIDTLKIDREFIVDSLENRKGAAIIKNIINLSRDIHVETVAEGIETLEQLNFLKSLGCDIGQGYYFARPMPEAEFLELLKKNREELGKV